MLNSCTYLRLPRPDFAVGAFHVSHTYEEIVAQQLAHAKRVSQQLSATGHSAVGAVRWRVLPAFAAAILPIRGWSAEQVERCFGGMTVPDVDGARIARMVRHAHCGAGYAVAAYARGGDQITVWLGSTDWDNADGDADWRPSVRSASLREDRPFLNFAGPWSSAMWDFENATEAGDFDPPKPPV